MLSQDKGFEDAKLVVEALKSKGFSAIGAVGFCWGGEFFIFYFTFFPLAINSLVNIILPLTRN